jgi:hypothetical protein
LWSYGLDRVQLTRYLNFQNRTQPYLTDFIRYLSLVHPKKLHNPHDIWNLISVNMSLVDSNIFPHPYKIPPKENIVNRFIIIVTKAITWNHNQAFRPQIIIKSRCIMENFPYKQGSGWRYISKEFDLLV